MLWNHAEEVKVGFFIDHSELVGSVTDHFAPDLLHLCPRNLLAKALAPDPLLDQGVQLRDDPLSPLHTGQVLVAPEVLQHEEQGRLLPVLLGLGLQGNVDCWG